MNNDWVKHTRERALWHWRSCDLPMLLFLVAFPLDMVIVKPIVLVAAVLFSWKSISWKTFKAVPPFYLLLPLAELIKFFVAQKDFSVAHISSFTIGIVYWLMSAVAFAFLYLRVQKKGTKSIQSSLLIYFFINLAWSGFNLLRIMLASKSINPYAVETEAFGGSSGDYIKGLLMGPSYLNLMVNSFFAVYFLYDKKYICSILAAVVAYATTSNFANIIFLPVLVACLFHLRSGKAVLTVAVQLLLFVAFNVFVAKSNMLYAMHSFQENGNLEAYLREKNISMKDYRQFDSLTRPAGKLSSIIETKKYLWQSPGHLLLGAGIGNFSSQLALRTSDLVQQKKSRVFQHVPQYIDSAFYKNHYQIFSAIYKMPPGFHSIRHFPTSFANQLAGEYGLLGIVLFLVGYLGFFVRSIRLLSFAPWLLLLVCGYLLFDYLFEYLSVMVFFELFFLIDFYKKPAAADGSE